MPLRRAGLRGRDLSVAMSTIAVIDFETTGMSPSMGSRATEVAVVLVEDGRIVGRLQSLMNSGAWIPPFIEALTGISNAMLADAPPARAVMHEVMRFTRGVPLVAHNAAFDRGFWAAEAPNHRLGTLADWHGLPKNGRAHRALADAEVTAHLLLRLQADLRERHAALLEDCGGKPDHDALCAVQRLSRREIARRAGRFSAAAASAP